MQEVILEVNMWSMEHVVTPFFKFVKATVMLDIYLTSF